MLHLVAGYFKVWIVSLIGKPVLSFDSISEKYSVHGTVFIIPLSTIAFPEGKFHIMLFKKTITDSELPILPP